MTTKFLTTKFVKNFPNFIVMEFPRKSSIFGQFSLNSPPSPTPPPKRILLLSFRRL